MRPDVVVAIGGDGTFLYTLGRTSAPVLPINAGTVGVLAESVASERLSELDGAIERLLSGFYHLEERMKLGGETWEASRSPTPPTNTWSTPRARGGWGCSRSRSTGSWRAGSGPTASSSPPPRGPPRTPSARFGPIVDPGLDALVLTAIAPFRAEARAIVVEPLHTLRLRNILPGREAIAIADGQTEFAMAPDAALTVYRSPRRATFVRFGSTFFYRLRGKRILPWSEDMEGGSGDRADVPPLP